MNAMTKPLVNGLGRIGEPSVKAVLLFGSETRGEAEELSDLDVLILHEGCELRDPVKRRRFFYKLVREAIGTYSGDLTVLDMELQHFLNPEEITSLLLNIYWDAWVVMDKTGRLHGFLKRLKENIAKSGLRRIKDGRAYRWMLPEPLKEVKIL